MPAAVPSLGGKNVVASGITKKSGPACPAISCIQAVRMASPSRTPTPTSTPSGDQAKTVYEVWKAFDFEGTIGAHHEVYEKVINNMTKGIQEKTDLITYVKTFTNSLKGRETCAIKEIEGILSYFKTSFAKLLERSCFSEKSFTDFYKKVAELSDPTSYLLAANVMSATVKKLETEVHGLAQRLETEAESGTAVKQLQENLKAEKERTESATTYTRTLEAKLEAAIASTEAVKQKLSSLTTQHENLQEKTLMLTEELNKTQYNTDSRYEGLQEENTVLSQQLADADTRIRELQRNTWQGEAETLRDEVAELRSSIKAHEFQATKAAEATIVLEDTVARLEGEKAVLTKLTKRSPSHGVADNDATQTTRLQKAMLELNIPKAESIADEYDAVVILKELHDRSTGLASSLKQKEFEIQSLKAQNDDVSLSLETCNESLHAVRERLSNVACERAGGGDKVFDLSKLVSKENHVIDMEGAGDAEVSLLTTQRATLRQKISDVEARNDRLLAEVDKLRRRATFSPQPQRSIQDTRGGQNTGFNSFTYSIMKVLNTNQYTRGFVVVYMSFLHMFVFFVLYWLTKEYSDQRRVTERYSF